MIYTLFSCKNKYWWLNKGVEGPIDIRSSEQKGKISNF